MNYQDNLHTLYVAVCFLLFGAVCLCIYTACYVILFTLKKSLFYPEAINDYIAKRNLSLLKQNIKKQLLFGKNEILYGEFFDCLFIISVGIFLTLLNYILLDGEVRIYALVAFLVGFFISKKLLSKHIQSIISGIIGYIYISFFVLLSPALTIINHFKSKRKQKDEKAN